jgi:hypothetical protein
VVLLVLLGVIAAIVAVLYFTVPIHSLPSFIPGHAARGTGHHTKRDIAAAVVAVVLLILAAFIGFARPRGTPTPPW